jgi:hypothetical protein
LPRHARTSPSLCEAIDIQWQHHSHDGISTGGGMVGQHHHQLAGWGQLHCTTNEGKRLQLIGEVSVYCGSHESNSNAVRFSRNGPRLTKDVYEIVLSEHVSVWSSGNPHTLGIT